MEKAKIVKEALEGNQKILITRLGVSGLSVLTTKFVPWGGEYVENGHILFHNNAGSLDVKDIPSGYGQPAQWSHKAAGIFDIDCDRKKGQFTGARGPLKFSVTYEDDNEKNTFSTVIKVSYNIQNHILASCESATSYKLNNLPDEIDLNIEGFGVVKVARESNKSKFYFGIVKINGLPSSITSKNLDFVAEEMPNKWPPENKKPTMAYKISQMELKQDPIVEELEV